MRLLPVVLAAALTVLSGMPVHLAGGCDPGSCGVECTCACTPDVPSCCAEGGEACDGDDASRAKVLLQAGCPCGGQHEGWCSTFGPKLFLVTRPAAVHLPWRASWPDPPPLRTVTHDREAPEPPPPRFADVS